MKFVASLRPSAKGVLLMGVLLVCFVSLRPPRMAYAPMRVRGDHLEYVWQSYRQDWVWRYGDYDMALGFDTRRYVSELVGIIFGASGFTWIASMAEPLVRARWARRKGTSL